MCVLQVCANSCRLNIMVQRVPTQYEKLSFSVCHYQYIMIVMAPLPGYIFTVIRTLSAPFCMNPHEPRSSCAYRVRFIEHPFDDCINPRTDIPGHDQWSGLRMGNAGSLNQIWQSNLTCSFNAKRTGLVARVTQRSRAFTILHCTATW